MLSAPGKNIASDRFDEDTDAFTAALPGVRSDLVPLMNRLASPREPLRIGLFDAEAVLEATVADGAAIDGLHVGFVLGDEMGWFEIPPSLASRLAEAIGLLGELAGETPNARALLVEFALLEALQAIEAASGVPARILDEVPAMTPDAVRFDVSVGIGDASHACALALEPQLAERFAAARDARPSREAFDTAALRATIVVAAGRQRLTLGEIESLEPGDVVMIEPPDRLVASLRGWGRACVERVKEGFRLVAGPKGPALGSEQEKRSMSDAGEGEDGLEGVPIGLVFECGRVELPLAEIRKLGPGSVLALERAAENAVDIVANGRRIGRGSLVRIGEGLGVRILQLSTRG